MTRMSTAVCGATSVPLTCHSGVRAGTADVEQRHRAGCASGDAALACLPHSTATCADSPRNFHSLSRKAGAGGRKSVFMSACDKRETMLLLLPWLLSRRQRY